VDCGGASCGKCADGKGCKSAADCSGGICNAGTCASPTCTDKVKNGKETDVDCGGGTCLGCLAGKKCVKGTDCQSGLCTAGICLPATCGDRKKNGSETGADCGGSCATTLGMGLACKAHGDCKHGVCDATAKTCRMAITCDELHKAQAGLVDGVYAIDPGTTSDMGCVKAYCDMTTDGGGWTLVRVASKKNGTQRNAAITSKAYNYPPPVLSPSVTDNFKVTDTVINALKSQNAYFIRVGSGAGYVHRGCVFNSMSVQTGASGPCSYGSRAYKGPLGYYNNGKLANAYYWAHGFVLGCWEAGHQTKCTPGLCPTGWKNTCNDYRHGWHAAPYDVTAVTLWVK